MSKKDPREIGKAWKFFVKNYKFTYVIIIGLIILGLVSAAQIPKESNPEVEVPYAMVMTMYPGASAEDVEELVTNPIEDKIKSLSELELMTSTSSSGLSAIFVQFEMSADVNEKITDLKEAVDNAKFELPQDAEDPNVQKLNFSDTPVFTFALAGPFPIEQLTEYAEVVKDEVESVSGVSTVRVSGGRQREIQVIVDKAQLDSYGLALQQVTQAISSANSDIPAGSIETADTKYVVRFAGRLMNAEEVKDIPILNIDFVPITVGDVAQVVDGYAKSTTISKLNLDKIESVPAVSLSVYKVTGGNILNIEEDAIEKLEQVQEEILPEGIDFEITLNIAEFIKRDLNNLSKNGLQTVLIIFLLLLVFLGWKEALLAGLAVPMTFLMTFSFLAYAGYTLNFLTLFSLILALGVLVDGAIVITEGINKYLKMGIKPRKAAYLTIEEFQLPLLAGILTTVFVFLPMMLTSGIIGAFIKSIPVTVSVVLISSFIVAIAFITTVSTRFLKTKPQKQINFIPEKKRKKIDFQKYRDKIIGVIYEWYGEKITNLINRKTSRRIFIIFIVLAFIGSMALPAMGILKVNMFPSSNEDQFYIDMQMPVGTPLDVTYKEVLGVEDVLLNDSRVKSYVLGVGSTSNIDSFVDTESAGTTNQANFVVKLIDERDFTSAEMVEEYEQKLKQFSNLDINIYQLEGGPPSGAPVVIEIKGESLDVLEDLGDQFVEILEQTPGTRDVKSTKAESPGEFVIQIDRLKAQIYGVSTVQLAATLRNAISGLDATVIKKDGQDIDVLVKYDLDNQLNDGEGSDTIDLDTIQSLTIATQQGDIPLSTFTNSFIGYSRPSISHEDGQRVISATSYTKNDVQAQEIFQKVSDRMDEINIPDGYVVSLGGESEDIEESFTDMFKAFIIGVILIGALLVLQFKSYRQALFILITIPLAMIGVIFGLVLMDQPLSFPAAIGLVALAGIVVNNAIILIDKINRNIGDGQEKNGAIIDACMSRVQPILLTTVTTVSGVLPLAMSDPTWGPLGYSIAFGLSFSMILTLMVVPLLYRRFGQNPKIKPEQGPKEIDPKYGRIGYENNTLENNLEGNIVIE